jgi:ArsR family transcriptional regulator, zinc-responsive transcriptional repressor
VVHPTTVTIAAPARSCVDLRTAVTLHWHMLTLQNCADSDRTVDRAPTPAYYLRMYADKGACSRRLPDDQVDLVVEVFRMLADATRVQVLWALVSREMSVNDLATHIGKPAPSVSQHLAKLRMARLVRTRRDGTTIFYSLDNEHIGQLVADAVFNAEHAGPGVPGHHRDVPELATLHPASVTAEPNPGRTKGRRA